jgi:Ricin-type beta-trefoil lectin domain
MRPARTSRPWIRAAVIAALAAWLCLPFISATPAGATTRSGGVGTPAGVVSAAPAAGIHPAATAGVQASAAASLTAPAGDYLTPDVLAEAYGLQGTIYSIGSIGGTIQTGTENSNDQGEEMTVAVVEAGLPFDGDTLAAGNAQVESDLDSYRSAYGLPPCTTGDGCLSVINGDGTPANYYGWGPDYAMDLDAISAICTECHIVLVESPTDLISDYAASVKIAATTAGVDVVDMNFTTPEFQTDASGNSEQYYDTSDMANPGVAMIAPSGGGGYGPLNYPAASPDVISVGGTVVNDTTSSGTWATTSAWSGTTSGCSAYELAPSWQTDAATLCPGDGNGATRVDNDLAAAAAISANSGAVTTAAFPFAYNGTWNYGGGTGLSADIIAGIYALAGPPEAATNPASYLYANATASGYDLTDVTTGTITGCPTSDALCTASAGWDAVTGWGSPNTTLTLTPTGSVTGHITGRIGDCVDNWNGAESNGNKIAWDTCGADDQTWTVNDNGSITMFSGQYCLAIHDGGSSTGDIVVLHTCNGAAYEQWRFTGDYGLLNPNSGDCLDDPESVATNGTLANGDQLALEVCNDINFTQDYSQPYSVPTVTGEIHSKDVTSQCVDNYHSELKAGNTIDIYTCDGGTDSQEWTVAANGSIQLDGGKYCLDGNIAENAELNTCDYDADDTQLWIVLSDGSLYSPAYQWCLEETGTTNLDPLELNPCGFVSSQEWTLP